MVDNGSACSVFRLKLERHKLPEQYLVRLIKISTLHVQAAIN